MGLYTALGIGLSVPAERLAGHSRSIYRIGRIHRQADAMQRVGLRSANRIGGV